MRVPPSASSFYARLLLLYPPEHREAFGEQMLRTFEDSYRAAASSTGKVSFGFWSRPSGTRRAAPPASRWQPRALGEGADTCRLL